ncbi:ESX secretion-associated protein EspG [Amycolatopsis nigrescens]|uniref:ESX secretion-associated protein EspG n=1 Tax=Amycolatopsis nigrescens TaxID=381445 RepID=UPI00036F24CD|nr:ESX secretion-associated protein EspG [Amycolatopsis nigrescens]
MLDRQLKFTTPTLLNLIKRRGGEPHNTLASTPTWYSAEASRELDEQVNAVLTEHGLLTARGMDRGLIATVEAIAKPELEYYGWFEGEFPDAPANFTVYAGSAGGGAFVLLRTVGDEVVVVAPERPEELLRGFLNQLPKCRPGDGEPLAVGKTEFTTGRARPAEDGFSVLQGAPQATGQPAGERIQRIMGAKRIGAGSLYVAARDRAGGRTRIQRPLNFIDTVEGRWLMEEVPGSGEPSIVFTPATAELLGDRLRNAQGKLAPS